MLLVLIEKMQVVSVHLGTSGISWQTISRLFFIERRNNEFQFAISNSQLQIKKTVFK